MRYPHRAHRLKSLLYQKMTGVGHQTSRIAVQLLSYNHSRLSCEVAVDTTMRMSNLRLLLCGGSTLRTLSSTSHYTRTQSPYFSLSQRFLYRHKAGPPPYPSTSACSPSSSLAYYTKVEASIKAASDFFT